MIEQRWVRLGLEKGFVVKLDCQSWVDCTMSRWCQPANRLEGKLNMPAVPLTDDKRSVGEPSNCRLGADWVVNREGFDSPKTLCILGYKGSRTAGPR